MIGPDTETRRALEHLKQNREQGSQNGASGASADSPSGIPRLGVWGTGNYEQVNKDLTTFEPGSTSNNWGFTAGADYRLHPQLILGLAFNYSKVIGNFNNHGGDFDTESYGPLLYASVSPIANFFVDVAAGYATKHYNINRAVSAVGSDPGFPFTAPTTSGIVSGDTNGNQYLASILLGYDFHFGSVTVGPRAGANYQYITIGGFRETGSTGLELVYDNQHQTSLTTQVGVFTSMAISTRIGVFVPQGLFQWVHEFENNQRVIYFHFSEDFAQRRFRFQTDPPDRNYGNIGSGLVLALPNGLSTFVNYQVRVGYQHYTVQTVNFGLRVEF